MLILSSRRQGKVIKNMFSLQAKYPWVKDWVKNATQSKRFGKKSTDSLPLFKNNHYLCIQNTIKKMPEYDIALELARLHILQGADFVRHLKVLVQYSIFKAVENEKGIYAAEGNHREDFHAMFRHLYEK